MTPFLLIRLGIFAIFIALSGCGLTTAPEAAGPLDLFPTPERPAGQEDVIELRCEPIETVRMAIIGLGMRGSGAVRRYTFMEGVEIVALCDLETFNTDRAQKILTDKGFPEADLYNGAEDYKAICERDDIDLVYICTNWGKIGRAHV